MYNNLIISPRTGRCTITSSFLMNFITHGKVQLVGLLRTSVQLVAQTSD